MQRTFMMRSTMSCSVGLGLRIQDLLGGSQCRFIQIPEISTAKLMIGVVSIGISATTHMCGLEHVWSRTIESPWP